MVKHVLLCIGAVAAAIFLTLTPRTAEAHASLLSAVPGEGVTIIEPPRTFRLDFSNTPRRIEESGSALPVVVEDQWQHVTMTVSKGGVVIPYYNGQFNVSLGIPRDSWRKQGPWRLGDYLGEPMFGFLGEMDDLMIFDACLTDAEVRKLAAAKPDAR